MASKEFECLLQKPIYELLDGDTHVLKKADRGIGMPYLKGGALSSIATKFGVTQYQGGSRWTIVEDTLRHVINTDKISEFLSYLFDFSQFDYLRDLGNTELIKATYNEIVSAVIENINSHLLFSDKELKLVGSRFVITKIGTKPIIEAPVIKNIDSQYIQGLRDRIEENVASGDFDGVITKSRTLIEEMLFYIIEQRGEEVQSEGNLPKMYAQAKTLLGMNQNNGFDKRINAMLSGLEKIIQAIAEMRNTNSDAHGVGSKRIGVRKHEALLVVNSAITLSEYVLSVYKSKYN